MISYRTDGRFVILMTNGKSTDRERELLYAALRSDPKVADGALLIIDVREYSIQLTQSELQDRVRAMIESVASKVGASCAVLVGDTSLRIGLGLQLFAGNTNYRVGVFHGEAAARKWLAPG